MIDLAKLKTLVYSDGFTLDDVPFALRECVSYTFNDFDRTGDLRYHNGADWVEGFNQVFHFCHAEERNVNDKAFCITVSDGTATKLGLICVVDASWFQQYHAMLEIDGMRAAIAHAFGYDDVIIITGGVAAARVYVNGDNHDYRDAMIVPTYSALYANDTDWSAVDDADKPDVATVIGLAYPGDDAAKRSPVLVASTSSRIRAALPLEHYHTDTENVTTINTTCDGILLSKLEAVIATITAEAQRAKYVEDAIMDAVEAMPVFGLKLSDAVDKANAMRDALQYIPRP